MIQISERSGVQFLKTKFEKQPRLLSLLQCFATLNKLLLSFTVVQNERNHA